MPSLTVTEEEIHYTDSVSTPSESATVLYGFAFCLLTYLRVHKIRIRLQPFSTLVTRSILENCVFPALPPCVSCGLCPTFSFTFCISCLAQSSSVRLTACQQNDCDRFFVQQSFSMCFISCDRLYYNLPQRTLRFELHLENFVNSASVICDYQRVYHLAPAFFFYVFCWSWDWFRLFPTRSSIAHLYLSGFMTFYLTKLHYLS